MRESLSGACSRYAELYSAVTAGFHKEKVHLYGPCVGILLGKNVEVDKAKFQENWQFIKKKNTAVYSTIRGAAKIGLTAMISDAADPDKRSDALVEALNVLRKYFVNSMILPIPAMVMAEVADPEEYEKIAETAGKIFDDMSHTRPLCTTEEDVVYSLLLAKEGRTKESFHEELEKYLELLAGTFKVTAGVQTTALVLMLSPGEREEKCKKACALYEAVKAKGIKYSLEKDLACLAALTVYPGSPEQIVEELLEADGFLAKRREYGFFGCDRRSRLMHAALILDSAYRREQEAKNPVIAQIVADINAKNKAEKMADMYAKRLEEARASVVEGQVLEVEPVTEEELGFVEDAIYHPPISELLGALAAEQLAVHLALRNKAGAVSAYTTVLAKK